jgi:predicted AlkP superfamily phosphohydrolase/phosphomutase
MRSHPDVFELADLLITRCRAKTEYAIELMQREPWTFAIIGFAEAHDIGHFAWHMHDQDHPLFDRYKVASHGDPVEKVYVELDTAIGKLVDNAKDDSEIILFAGTGMENNFSANTGLDRILSLLEKSSRSTETPSKFADNSGHKTDFLALWNRLPPWLKKLRGIRNLRRSAMEHNRAASLCFALPYDDHCGAIRLNLKGREKHGRLAPGVEASSFCQRLIQELMAITYEETGEPLVKEVIPAEALFSGDRLGQLPDLFVIWNRDRHPLWTPDHSYTVVKSPTFGSMNIGPTIRTGDHTSEAMLILTGKGVPIGENISHMSLEDIAPTLCSLLGMVLPDTDGQAIPELRIHN